MIQTWKARHILTGMLTWLPILDVVRQRRASTGGSNSARYCYSVWFRHLVILDRYGFKVKGANIGELGPGDSIGMGLVALISGAARYVGLDVVPYSANAALEKMFDEVLHMYSGKERIPDHTEFPGVRPRLDSYEFPAHLIDWQDFLMRAKMIRDELKEGLNSGPLLGYRAPWTSLPHITEGSLDLIFSQAVLEHVDNLQETYQAMFAWLKPGGYASHVIDFNAHGRSPYWNGHWAYSDWQWKLVRGKREFLLNREPMSMHLAYAKKAGFEVLLLERSQRSHGLEVMALASRFRRMDALDAETSGVLLILQKPRVDLALSQSSAV